MSITPTRLAGLPAFRHDGFMELAKIGKKGQLTIPRSVLRAAGISEESRVMLEATADGAIVLRPVAVYPVEMYSDERVREFEETNTIPAAMEKRVQEYLKKRKKR
jgi:AbrB family looped-hinge helix DNA binding protein